MAKFNFKIENKQFSIILSSSEGYETAPIRLITFFSPSFEVRDDKFKFFESGVFKKSVSFNEIDKIEGVKPSDVIDAITRLYESIELTKITTI